MKDFPAFVTEHGAASLILREVPYRGIAYIHLQASCEPELLLQECVSFCRACGAEKLYAAGEAFGENGLNKYPLHTEIWTLRGTVQPGMDEFLPVNGQNAGRWREIYRTAMEHVDNAATLETRDEKRLLEEGQAGFALDGTGKCLGIVWIKDGELLSLASAEPHCGERTLRAAVKAETELTLEVASTNARALALYRRMGFLKTGVRSRWYRVFPIK